MSKLQLVFLIGLVVLIGLTMATFACRTAAEINDGFQMECDGINGSCELKWRPVE